MKTVFFHIGTPKTGSTFLQENLANVRDQIAEQGIYYHKIHTSRCENHWWFSIPFVHDPADYLPFSLDLLRGNSLESLEIRGLDSDKAFRNAAADTRFNTLVISAEQFLYLPCYSLRKIKEYFESLRLNIRVVCYFRDPFDYAASQINQQVKMGLSRLSELLENPPIPGYAQVMNFINVFGKDACIIRDYDLDRQSTGGILNSFMSIVGFNASVLELDSSNCSTSSNPSLSMLALHLIDAVNPYINAPPHTPRRDLLLKQVEEASGNYSKSYLTLPNSTINKINSKAKPLMDQLSEMTGGSIGYHSIKDTFKSSVESHELRVSADELYLLAAQVIGGYINLDC